MARCEDFPCCGHEPGCCPDFDDAGRQLNMKCVCGATLPIDSRYSICETCMNQDEDGDFEDRDFYDDDHEDDMTDVEADADTLKSAGMGTDEDYGGYEDFGWDGGMEM